MRNNITCFLYGMIFGIYIAGSSVESVLEDVESKVRSVRYRFNDWRKERDRKKNQEP